MLKRASSEKGQAVVEFALCLTILALLAFAPVDYFRFIYAKTVLCSAASESIGQLNYSSISSGSLDTDTLFNDIKTYCDDRIDSSNITIVTSEVFSPQKTGYKYYRYSSALADETDFNDRFEQIPSYYNHQKVEIQLEYKFSPITVWGGGLPEEIITPVYTRNIYSGGDEYGP